MSRHLLDIRRVVILPPSSCPPPARVLDAGSGDAGSRNNTGGGAGHDPRNGDDAEAAWSCEVKRWETSFVNLRLGKRGKAMSRSSRSECIS